MLRRLGALGFALGGSLLAFGACSATAPTEIVVAIDGDIRVDAVSVRVEVEGQEFGVEKSASLSREPFPLTLGVTGGSNPSARILVRVTGEREGKIVIQQTVRARLAEDESRVLLVSLCASCEAVSCGSEQTCSGSSGAGTCAAVPSLTSLPEWTGTPPRHTCSGEQNDGGTDGGDAPVVLQGGYREISDARLWSAVNLETTVDPLLRGYVGASFDGRYLYLTPWSSAVNLGPHGKVARFDTTQAFDAKASWSSFDLTTLNPNAKGYAGAATFGQDFLYLAPFDNGASDDVVARFKLSGAFDDPASWTFLALSTHAPTTGARGFGGAVVNKSHIWFPSRDPARPFVLHDNREANNPGRTIEGGWESFDVPTNVPVVNAQGGAVAKQASGYYGGAFDGNNMYFAPHRNAEGPHGVVLQKAVGAGTTQGWSALDLTSIDPAWAGFVSAVFDGKYIYFVPHENTVGRHGNVVRYDTTMTFTDAAAWTGINLPSATNQPDAIGFIGGVFDGRFVYLVPFFQDHEVVMRYDTTKPFDGAASWEAFDPKKLPGGVKRFNGGAFDGQYVYFIPYDGGPVVRFQARSERVSTVKTANGSFL